MFKLTSLERALGGVDRHLALPIFVNLDALRNSKLTDIVGDPDKLPLEDNTFDVILPSVCFKLDKAQVLTAGVYFSGVKE